MWGYHGVHDFCGGQGGSKTREWWKSGSLNGLFPTEARARAVKGAGFMENRTVYSLGP
jgi:hypothetical protein